MPESRFWRRIDLKILNVALYASIAALSALQWDALRWAGRECIKQLGGRIGAPPERQLTLKAVRILKEESPRPEARELLEQAISVEPSPQPIYWLGVYFQENRENDRALEQFRRCIRLDPLEARAYLRSADILIRKSRRSEAERTLAEGRKALRKAIGQYAPRADPSVDAKYNDKAFDAYEDAQEALRELDAAWARLKNQPGH